MNSVREFELYLVSQMRGKSKAASVLASAGIHSEAVSSAARHLGQEVGFDRVGHGIDLYLRVLGEPMQIVPEPGIGENEPFAGSVRYRFSLSLWPNLDFLVRAHRDGWAWGLEFVRRLGASAPNIRRHEELEPWTVVETEVRDCLGPFSVEDAWNYGKDASYVVDHAGARRRVSLLFDFALLQNVDRVFE